MITGIFHQGSGLGNQLFRYVATRVLAADKGYDWGMVAPELFKGASFMKINAVGKGWELPYSIEQGTGRVIPLWDYPQWHERRIMENGVDVRSYDPEFNFIADKTIIDGEFQDERYFQHRMPELREWLKTEPLWVPENICIIGFRGGEYSLYPDLFLPQEYWDNAMRLMLNKNPDMLFHVVTDDPETARKFFKDIPITHEIGDDWRMVRYARYAIVANSSFYILPRLLKHSEALKPSDGTAVTIAPRYWGRHNLKSWAMLQNFYKNFTYI